MGRRSAGGHLRFDEADGVAHRRQPRRDAVGDRDGEPLLARHDDLNDVEAVGAEILVEARIVGEAALVGTQMEDEDIPDFCGYIIHRTLPSTQAITPTARRGALWPRRNRRMTEDAVASQPHRERGPLSWTF